MNEIISFCDLNENNELLEKFEKSNLKRQDIYLVKAEGKCYICFKEKNDFKNRIKKWIHRIEDSIEKRIEVMNLIVR